jgi:hypothetical protein
MDDRYCTAQFNVQCGDVNPRHQNVRLYQHFAVDNSAGSEPVRHCAAHKDKEEGVVIQ